VRVVESRDLAESQRHIPHIDARIHGRRGVHKVRVLLMLQ
jgi:hypothetical protein